MKYTVVHDFLDTLGATAMPVLRKVGECYPPKGVDVPNRWMDYLVGHRTKDGLPILEAGSGKRKEALDAFDAE